MLHTLDAPAVRSWCQLALRALGQAREEIDALNVYPVPDGDTGTNLYLTVESAAAAVESRFADPGPGPAPGLAETVRAMARGALVGARGNSGVILAQWLRGTAETLAGGGGADQLRAALQRAADSAYQAVAEPVEGTLLTVARIAAREAARAGDGLGQVAEAAHRAARRPCGTPPSSSPSWPRTAWWTPAAGAWSPSSGRSPTRSPATSRWARSRCATTSGRWRAAGSMCARPGPATPPSR